MIRDMHFLLVYLQVFPVGLSKMRSESNFKVFKDADGIFVDMRDRQTGDLKAAVDKLFQ